MSVARTPPIRDEPENLASPHVVDLRSRDSAMPFECEPAVESGPAGNIVVLRLAGEIDLLTIPTVRAALVEAVAQRPADLVIDLAAVSFCCVRGFALLAATAHDAQSSGICCAVSGMRPHLDRVASMLWPEQLCVRIRSVAAAVAAIRIDQTYRDT
ncbi:STAS domain-containing protein [Pseudonocardia sp. DLS-67]